MPIAEILPEKGVFAIAGICKNAGKTTVLNWLLQNVYAPKAAVLTTGRDGEAEDAVFGNPKPPVVIPQGAIFCSDSAALQALGAAVTILDKLQRTTINRELWLSRAQQEVKTRIYGPATVADQIHCIKLMRQHGGEVILIDGSLDRKSIAAHPEINGIYLVAGGSYGTPDKIVEELHRLMMLSGVTSFSTCKSFDASQNLFFRVKNRWQESKLISLLGHENELLELMEREKPDRIYFSTALTDNLYPKLEKALKKLEKLIVNHPLQLQMSKKHLETLLKDTNVLTINLFRIKAIALNSWSVTGNHLDSDEFRNRVRKEFPRKPVFDVFEKPASD